MSFAVRRAVRTFVWLLCLGGIAPVGEATTLRRIEFPELVRTASAIARIRCGESRTAWKNGEIWTETPCTVLEEFKGTLPKEVLLVHPGGKAGQLTAQVDGSPRFGNGEELYAFLWAHADGSYSVLGWSQGAFRLRHRGHNRAEVVTQESAETPVYNVRTRKFAAIGLREMPMESFRAKLVREIAKTEGMRSPQ